MSPTGGTGQLGPRQRERDLERAAAETFDIVVIGGGVTGAGAALDAASRGLRVALVEARDLAFGTSSRSGKTLHGGLRYLQQLNFSLVREAAHERNRLINHIAPYLVTATPFLLPLEKPLVSRAFFGAGVLLYDVLGGLRTPIPRHRHLSRAGSLREAPSLRGDRIVGGIQYYDGIVDDARLTLVLARTAASLGAVVLTDAPALSVVEENGRVAGVTVHDSDGGSVVLRARTVINASGIWSEGVQELAGRAGVSVRPAKGAHIVLPAGSIRSSTGLIVPAHDSVLVARPWSNGRFWIVGTTDTPYSEDRERPVATTTDVDYLLDELNGWLDPTVSRSDVLGTYAGLRPLVTGSAKSTAQLSRTHSVMVGETGLVSVVGGKYTTYRTMAKDAVDRAVSLLPGGAPRSATAGLALLGTGPAVSPDPALAGRYGSLVSELDELVDGDHELARELPGGGGVLAAEIHYAASHEGARTLDDALARRTHISIETADHGEAAAPEAARILGAVLGWSEQRQRDEVAAYQALVRHEQGVLTA